jgi:acyl carrier protein
LLSFPVEIRTHTGLFDDLALDSPQAFQLLVIVESLAGAEVPTPTLSGDVRDV